MSYVRTPEHRALRAALIQRWKPWEKSTGPKTEEGKEVVARNAWRGAPRVAVRNARKLEQLVSADDLVWDEAKNDPVAESPK